MGNIWLTSGFALILAGTGLASAAQAAEPAMSCLAEGSMREVIAAKKVVAPAAALKAARGQVPGADIVRANLCWRGETLYYVVTALKRDGHVVPVRVDAVSGKVASDR